MPLLPILAISWPVYIMATLFVIVCLLMMLVILIQKPKGGGLSGAFGGGAGTGSQQAFLGARAGDVLTLVTIFFFICFVGLAMGLTWAINPDEELPPAQAAATAGEPATPAGQPTPQPPGEVEAEAPMPQMPGGFLNQTQNDQPDPTLILSPESDDETNDPAAAPTTQPAP